MLLVKTFLAPSAIHGVGVFAGEAVAAGERVWRYEPEFDRLIPFDALPTLPPAFRAYLDMYAYPSRDVPGGLTLSCDHAKFLNHSPDPNTELLPFETLARRSIARGEEITCDYGAFCVGWTGFD